MKALQWWSPNVSGNLLSRQWVQTFVFELPDLNPTELQSSLRYKVQATLPVNTEQFVFHTQHFRRKKKTYGVAFLAPKEVAESFPRPARDLKVAVPLTLPEELGGQVLLFVLTPDGVSPHLYESGILSTSFAQMATDDRYLRQKLVEKFPEAQVWCFCPVPETPIPAALVESQLNEATHRQLLSSLPNWDPPPTSPLPAIFGTLLLVAGLTFAGLNLVGQWSAREQRNETWRHWLTQNESQANTLAGPQKKSQWIKSIGVPVPELFSHLSKAWGDTTKVEALDWHQGKLTLTAESSSALTSLKKLTTDPWFKAIKVIDIRTQKDGIESFSVEGGLSLDQ